MCQRGSNPPSSPRIVARIGERVVTDEKWRLSTGAVTFDGIRNGESDDARLEKPSPRSTIAKGETRTLRGVVHSDWKIDNGNLVLSVVIPVNSIATVYVRAVSHGAVTAEGAMFLRSEPGRQVFSVGSGAYVFTVKR